jgi:hypothetical protein
MAALDLHTRSGHKAVAGSRSLRVLRVSHGSIRDLLEAHVCLRRPVWHILSLKFARVLPPALDVELRDVLVGL